MQLLLAEDDPILANGLTAQLNAAGFTVEHAPNGPVAEYLLTRQNFDIAIIDLGLPMVDGLTVLKNLRATRPDLPVLVLTALDRLDSRVAGLNAGADDYMTKPFEFPELEARLRAILRRARTSAAAPADVALSGLHFDRAARRAVIHGEPVELSPREATLLELLLVPAEVHIHRLRRKLEGSGMEIRTVRGLGYLLAVERADGRPA